tara:strand:- start:884 stop:1198 length:315 start_codon:yes stop_codon:yes gene_type:complete
MNNKEIYFKQNPKDEDSIQWVIDILESYCRPVRDSFNINGQSIYHSREMNNLGDIKADRYIYICSKCDSCWEHGRTPGEKDYYIYDNFPKFGKKNKKDCPECQK